MNLRNHVESQIESLEMEVARGCGASDVLYERRLQSGFEDILDKAAPEHKQEVELILREHGYDPDMEPFVAGPGECELTGIEIDCCPCGRHE